MKHTPLNLDITNRNVTKKNIVNRRDSKVKNLVITGMFTAIICVLSQISIPTQPIPFTLGLFAIFLTGALLPPRAAFLSVLAYLLLGAFGLPVFAGFKGGIHALTGMTGGYLMAYPIMALVTSSLFKYSKKWKLLFLAAGMVLSLILCYVIGTLWFTFVTDNSFYTALTLCVFPFIIFDLMKIGFAIFTSTIIKKAIDKVITNE
ncbi:MAG: biotin transporter BioY [Clostridiales bacterium]|jgi:biotin transport system substrate-specific component|nr:biotin transporter BioY [Clostridiales bacterium]